MNVGDTITMLGFVNGAPAATAVRTTVRRVFDTFLEASFSAQPDDYCAALLREEGLIWIRGDHTEESSEFQALLAAWSLHR